MFKGNFQIETSASSLDQSIVSDICVVFYGRLGHEELVGCMCAFRMAGYPRVVRTVHFPFALIYCYFISGVGHDPCRGDYSKGTV